MTTEPPSTLRLQLRHAGYHPLPVNGKAPTMEEWQTKLETNDDEIKLWDSMWRYARNTGVLARFCPGLDIDLLDRDAAEAIERLARDAFGEHGDVLLRVGKWPKRLIPLRTDEPFPKLLRLFVPPNAVLPILEKDCHRIEVLADGQQWIAYGIHPDTKQPWTWPRGELVATERVNLPYVRSPDMAKFLDEAAHVLITDFGYQLFKPPQPSGHTYQRRTDSKYGELNERALANLDKWVPKLFLTAKSSADLGRGREEDLSLDPRGIKYFGDADMGDPRQGRRTPIDVVMDWNHLDLIDGVRWLERALDQTAPQEPPTEDPPQDPPRSPRFTLKQFSMITISTAPNYLVKGILPRSGLVVVWGPPKCGKSFWTFDLVMHVAIGRDYRGRRVRQGSVVYLALEGGSGFAGRIEAWRTHCLGEHDQAVPFFLLDMPLDLVADHRELVAAIREQLGGVGPAIVVVDTLNRAIQGDENKSDDMSKFIRAADAIRTAFGSLVLIVHHCGVVKNRPRGHTSLAGADDAQIAVERDKNGIITATVEHAKDFEGGAVIAAKLGPVELGEDADGDKLTSCIITASDAARSPKLTKTQTLAFDVLKRLINDHGEKPPADLNLPKDCRVVRQVVWREEFYKVHPAEKAGSKQKAFVRVHADLYEAHLVQYLGEFACLCPDKPDI